MKYGNRKTEINGITFDSRLEASRYYELCLLEKAGVIKDLRVQPKYKLIPSFKKNGKTYRAINYIADFSYFDNEKGMQVVEDTKGYETEVFKIKKKLFEYFYPNLTLKEIFK